MEAAWNEVWWGFHSLNRSRVHHTPGVQKIAPLDVRLSLPVHISGKPEIPPRPIETIIEFNEGVFMNVSGLAPHSSVVTCSQKITDSL